MNAQLTALYARTPTFYDLEEIPGLGWVQITDIGEENFYFTLADGSKGFAKHGG